MKASCCSPFILEKVMRVRSAAWAGGLLLSLLFSSCTRSTPGNTPSSEAQPTPDTTAQSSPAPAAGGKPESAPAPEKAPNTKPEHPQTAQQEAPAATPAPPPPIVLPAGTVLAVRLNTALGSSSS